LEGRRKSLGVSHSFTFFFSEGKGTNTQRGRARGREEEEEEEQALTRGGKKKPMMKRKMSAPLKLAIVVE